MRQGTRIAVLAAIVLALPTTAQEKQFITPADPTIIDFMIIEPHNLAEHIDGVDTIALREDLSFPPDPDATLQFPPINGLHRLQNPGQFIFSLADGYLSTELGRPVTGIDIVRVDGAGSYQFFFCGASTVDALDIQYPIDAIYLDGGDNGDLVMSFRSSGTVLRGTFFRQADLARFRRVGPGCEDWEFVEQEFDSTGHVPAGVDLVGATWVTGGIVMSFDVPTDISGNTTSLSVRPANLVLWDDAEFTFFAELTQWQDAPPLSSVSLPPDTCTDLGDPGPGDDPVRTCATTWMTDLMQNRDRIEWRPVDGAGSYNVYAAFLSTLDMFTPECQAKETTDTQFSLSEVPPSGDGFYVLVSVVSPLGEEGSLGQDWTAAERPNPQPCATFPPAESRVATTR